MKTADVMEKLMKKNFSKSINSTTVILKTTDKKGADEKGKRLPVLLKFYILTISKKSIEVILVK